MTKTSEDRWVTVEMKTLETTKHTPTYTVKPFYSQDNPSDYPSGWDVWENDSVVVSPCDTKEEAEREAIRLTQATGQ